MTKFAGALTALITPFRGGEVDYKALSELVEAQIQGGIDGLVPCGTTGESVNLGDAEYAGIIRAVVQAAKGRIPVVAGAGSASTKHSLELCKIAREAGADGVLLVTPYYNRPTQEGLYAHFHKIGTEASLPIILYNIPSRTGSDLAMATLERLAEVKQIVAVKEATGNVLRSQEIAAFFGDRFTILSGDDALTLAVMAVGGDGVISVTSNFAPKPVSDVVHLFRGGDLLAARALHQKLLPLHGAMFVEVNPAPVKAALAMRGKIAPEIRLPLVWPSEASLERIRLAIQRAEQEL
jgi:4-hydroxy-tetrahydrodipicolinate synthase